MLLLRGPNLCPKGKVGLMIISRYPILKDKEYIKKGGQKVKNVMSTGGTFCAGRKPTIGYMEINNPGNYS